MAGEVEHVSIKAPILGEVEVSGSLAPRDLLGKVLTVDGICLETDQGLRPLRRKDTGKLVTAIAISEGTRGEGWVEVYATDAETGKRSLLQESIVAWDPTVAHDRTEIEDSPPLSTFVSQLARAGYPTIFHDEIPSIAEDTGPKSLGR